MITARQVTGYILCITKHFKVGIFVMFAVAIIWATWISAQPYLLKFMINTLHSLPVEEGVDAIIMPIILYICFVSCVSAAFRAYDYFVHLKMVPMMRRKIATEAMDKLLSRDQAYYQDKFSGSLANKVNDLVRTVPEILQSLLDRFLSHTLMLICAILTLYTANIKFAVLMLSWVLFILSVAYFLSGRLQKESDHWAEVGSAVTGKFVDILSNIISVRLFSARVYENKAIKKICDAATHAEQKVQWTYFCLWLIYGLTALILQAANFYLLIDGYKSGTLTAGDFALVMMISIAIIDCLWGLAREFSTVAQSYGRITQALSIIYDKHGIVDKVNATALKTQDGMIVFENVKFHYKGTEALFNKKSVLIEGGQKVGLVGYSGGGKTTFINLILRLYDVTEGRILIDGYDICDVTQDSLRDAIAMIPQDPSLFHRTLMENIRYGSPSASDADVIKAAKAANAHEFICELPEGYESLIGERGVKLSGGQRQRIAIARAILKNASILILDEATSQLDSLTEEKIQQSLWRAIKGKTTLVVAHRLSTLLHMDRILVFNKGKIVEDGSHNELLKADGLYKKLWNSQVDGFLQD